jgi:predicted TIM-barrel fold metal-dependent hydrolase
MDAHHHVWDLAARPQPWTSDIPQRNKSFTIGELRSELRLHRIDATIVVQTIPVAAGTPDHAGNPEIRPGGLLARSVQRAQLAACPNVTMKLSGLVIGAADALTAALGPAERAALFGGTAARWCGIPAC